MKLFRLLADNETPELIRFYTRGTISVAQAEGIDTSGSSQADAGGQQVQVVGRRQGPRPQRPGQLVQGRREDGSKVSFRLFISTWFGGVPYRSVQRGNMLTFLCWSFFNQPAGLCSPAQMDEAEAMLERIEELNDYRFPPGYDTSIRPHRLTLDPVLSVHRPLLAYAVVALANRVGRVLYQWRGFRRLRLGGFTYWYRPGPPGCKLLPLVFMHGLGQGIVTYVHFLTRFEDRPMVLMELNFVSMRMAEHIPSPQETADAVYTILFENGFSQAIFMGHSFGTSTTAWCLSKRPSMVHSIVLIDPVSVLGCIPITLYSFIFAPPPNFVAWFIRTVVTRELSVARLLFRHFRWWDSAIWIEDLLPRVGLSPSHSSATEDLPLSSPGSDSSSDELVRVDEQGASTRIRHSSRRGEQRSRLSSGAPQLDSAITSTYFAHSDSSADEEVDAPSRRSRRRRELGSHFHPFLTTTTAAVASVDSKHHVRTADEIIKMALVLGGEDKYVPSDPIKIYVRERKAEEFVHVMYYEDMDHARFLLKPSVMDDIKDKVDEFDPFYVRE